jgi:hypothetical protein
MKTRSKTVAELMELIVATFPKAIVDESMGGEIVVWTGLAAENGELDNPSAAVVPIEHYV